MPMTLTEKILAAHAGRKRVEPGELINARVDLVLGNDVTAPMALQEFLKIGIEEVFDRNRIALVPDHFTPNKDIKSAEQAKILRQFAEKHDLPHYFEVGRMGIEHCLLPEQGLVGPGDLVIGASDTVTSQFLVPYLGRWAPFPPVWAAPTWLRRWPWARPGLRYRSP